MTREEFDPILASAQGFLKKYVRGFERNLDAQKDLIQETNMRALTYFYQFVGDEADMRRWLTSVIRTVVKKACMERTRLKNNPTTVVVLNSQNQEKRVNLRPLLSLDQLVGRTPGGIKKFLADATTPEGILLTKEEAGMWETQWKKILQYQKHPDWDILWSFYQKEDLSLSKGGKWVPFRTEKYKEISQERGGDLSAEQLKKKVFQLKRKMIRELVGL